MAKAKVKTKGRAQRFRPHNANFPLELRKYPICYLCGGSWEKWSQKSVGKRREFKTWKVTIQCTHCKLLTYAYADEGVMHSREWIKH